MLVRTIGFFLLPVYTRFLTPEDYGVTNLVNVFSQIATYIISFSLYTAVVRFYTDYKEDREKLKRFYGTVITFVLISGIVFVSVAIIFKDILFSWFFQSISYYPIILISLLTLVFVSMHTIHQNIMQGMQQGKKLTIVNLVVFGIQVGLNLFFIGVIKIGALGVFLSNLIINAGYCIFMVVDLKVNNLVTFCIDKDILKDSLRYSIPLIPHNISTQIASFASRVIINRNSSLSSVGLYSMASQFGAIIDTVQTSVNQAFAPWFYEAMDSCDKEVKCDIVNFSYFLLIIYSFIYMGVGLFSHEVIILLTNESYIMAWTAIPLIVIAYSVKSIYYFYTNILFYYKEASNKLFIATFTGSFIDIILSFILVPKYGMYGAALSFLIAKIIVVIIVVFISKSLEDIGYRVIEMLKIIIPSILFIGAGLYFSYTKYITEFSWNNFAYKVIVLFIYVFYLYFTNKDLIVKSLINLGLKNLTELNHEKVSSTINGSFRIIYMFVINKIYRIKRNKVVFSSFDGRSYSDNPKAISEKLNKINPEFEIVWLLNDHKKKRKILPYYVRAVDSRSLKALRELATSKVWVDNSCKSLNMYKSKEQIYIQTWHGDRGFKKFLHDSDFVTEDYKIFESENVNLMVSGSDYGCKNCKTAFKYVGDILNLGCPKNDLLVLNITANKYEIKKKLNIYRDFNILLYTPILSYAAADIDLTLIIRALESKTKNEWICLVRECGDIKRVNKNSRNEKKIIDVTSYEDMSELLLISDFLITDFSSCSGDFALLNRPIILHQPDRTKFIQEYGAFYFKLDNSPYMISQSNEELLKLILNLEWDSIPQNCRDILDFFGTVETGESSRAVVEYIVSKFERK